MHKKSRELRQYKSGIYYAAFYCKNKHRRKSLGTRDYFEAIERLAEYRKLVAEGVECLFMTFENVKLSQALERACYEHFKHYADPKTPRAHVKKLIEIVGDLFLHKLRATHVNKMRVTLLEQGLKKATVNQYMGDLRVILHLARDEWEVIKSFPAIPKFRETGNRKFILSMELENEAITWMRAQDEVRTPWMKWAWSEYIDLFVVLVDTGLRLSEALNLTATDIYDNELIVRPEVSKGRKLRGVPLSPDSKKILMRRISRAASRESLLFNDITKWSAIERIRRVKRGLQLQHTDFGWHSLRHTCATRLLRAGANLAVVQEWLGHSSINTTLKYVKLVDEMKNDAMVNMSNMFRRRPDSSLG